MKTFRFIAKYFPSSLSYSYRCKGKINSKMIFFLQDKKYIQGSVISWYTFATCLFYISFLERAFQ